MKPLAANEIRGIWGTVLLPLNADGSIDYARLSDEIFCLLEAGLDGIYTNGTANEFYAQTEDEFDRISELVAQACERRGTRFQLGVSHTCPQTSLARLERAVQWNPGAVQVILPDWAPVSDDESVCFLRGLADKAEGVPLVLYNPPHAKRVLSPSNYSVLKRSVPQLVGLKIGDGDASWYTELRKHAAGLSIFVPGHHMATGIREGAHGSYSNVACLSPFGAKRWYKLMQTDLQAALEMEVRVRRFFSDQIQPLRSRGNYSNAALDKMLAAIGNWANIGTRLRWPYCSVEECLISDLRRAAHGLIPEFLEEQHV